MSRPPTNQSTSHFDLQPLLRPSEHLLVSAPCRIRVDGSSFTKAEVSAVLSRSNEGDEAAVLVVIPPSLEEDIRITHVIPINPSFKHYLNQTPPSPSNSFFHQSSKPHITLALQNGDLKVDLRIASSHTILVQNLVAELRRLVDASRGSAFPEGLSHSWLNLYPVNPPTWNDLSDDEVTTPGDVTTSSLISPALSSASMQTLKAPLTAMSITPGDEDEEHPNPRQPSFSRTSFLRKRLFAQQDRWSTRAKVRVRLATYNVNDKLPPQGTTELASLVGNGEDDILIFGFQELDLRSQAMLVSQGSARAAEWEGAIRRGLGVKADQYDKIACTQYVGVMTLAFVKKSLRDAVSAVETSEKGVGLLGFGGNKAGVAVRLKVYDTTFCFVNSHLAAFAQALDRRRSDYQTLVRGLVFPRPVAVEHPAFNEFLDGHPDRLMTVQDSHILFWIGDLNYRVDMADDVLRAWYHEKKWSLILEKDQLNSDIASQKSFAGFREAAIDFPPSYKYVIASSTLDSKRSPAYTDRILWSQQSTSLSASNVSSASLVPSPPEPHRLGVECTEYTSHEVMWSDHRPVSAAFTTEVRVVDQDKRKDVLSEIQREIDQLEEDYRPNLVVDSTNIEMGEVKYRTPVSSSTRIRNPGRVPASWAFKAPGLDKPISKAFLYPFPSSGTIEPGQDIELRVVAFVDEQWAPRLTLGDDMNDVLVLRVEGGKDTFIPVQATFAPSIIGLPLNILSALQTPISTLPLAERKSLATPPATDVNGGTRGQKAVKEIWSLLENLMSSGQGVTDLWTTHVDLKAVLSLVEVLNSGSPLSSDDPRLVAATLLHILFTLPSPLVPLKHQYSCIRASDRDEAFASLEDVGAVNTNVLIGLMSVIKLCAAPHVGFGPSVSGDTPAKQPELGNGSGGIAFSPESTTLAETTPSSIAEEKLVEAESEKKDNREAQVAQNSVESWKPDPESVERLVPAVFGVGRESMEGKTRFIRLLLED
ncbi:Endonuclease/exonuclease/phosphatase [Naematelia encephala]|uniref:Endonuclease/exonuclease/phosphatase n=1 Tax=Naematelia encephala TaxID=71784 RepID=A0A1Y2BBB7_9TREE|nr:Endonuclease/exonuclease/phosphatase [Naematelia encephala]